MHTGLQKIGRGMNILTFSVIRTLSENRSHRFCLICGSNGEPPFPQNALWDTRSYSCLEKGETKVGVFRHPENEAVM